MALDVDELRDALASPVIRRATLDTTRKQQTGSFGEDFMASAYQFLCISNALDHDHRF
jgi:hypothetical protein